MSPATAIVSRSLPAPSVAPPTLPSVATSPGAAGAPLHDVTPTGRPSWYGRRVGREERSWLSRTGDVELFAGNTFPTGFATASAALEHAMAAARDRASGSVLVFDAGAAAAREAADGARWFLARCYNVEHEAGTGLVLGRSSFGGSERLTSWHPEVAYVVSGERILTPAR